jgi:hypothetical protein
MKHRLNYLVLLGILAGVSLLTACSTKSSDENQQCQGAACESADTAGAEADLSQTQPDLEPNTDSSLPDEDSTLAEDTGLADPDIQTVDLTAPPEDMATLDETAPSDLVVIPLTELSTTAKFFSHHAGKVIVKFFAVLDSNGGVHVAFDACDICFGAKKGYSQQGQQMICNNCGNAFDISGIGTANRAGGCWPGYLEAVFTDTEVVIQPATLEAGSWYFE